MQVPESTWLGLSVVDRQRDQLRRLGLPEGESDDVIWLPPGVVATTSLLRRFQTATDGTSGDVYASPGAGGWASHAAFGVPAVIARFRGGGPIALDRLSQARRVEIELPTKKFEVPLLDVAGGRRGVVEAGDALLIRVDHWPGLLWANLLSLAGALAEALLGPWWMAPLRGALGVARSGSIRPEIASLPLVRRDAGAVIEPGAIVQGSWLMAGARVGPGAVVRHTIVGPGAIVEAQGLVLGSVLGPGARVQRRGFVSYGLLDREAICGGTLQLSYLGPRSQLKVGALLQDQVLGGSLRVPSVDGWASPPLGVLGAALGADAVVGAGVQVAAGRLVPAGVSIVASEDQVLVRPDAAPGRYRVRGGSLVPC